MDAEAYRDALAAVRHAEAQFADAEPEYIDAACLALTAAQARLRAILAAQKRGETIGDFRQNSAALEHGGGGA